MNAAFRRRATEDRGITLMELLVASGLLSLVVIVVGGLLVSLFSTERLVSGVAQGTTAAQLTATSIADRIRNASTFEVSGSAGSELLVARVASGGESIVWTCHAWYFTSEGDGAIRYTSGPDGTAITAPTSQQLETWSSLVEGVSAPEDGRVFTEEGNTVRVAFDAATGDAPAVAIRFAAPRLTGVEEVESCF